MSLYQNLGTNSLDTAEDKALNNIEKKTLDPFMSRNFDQETIDHIRNTVLPNAVRVGDKEIAQRCEVVLAKYGEFAPNTVSGFWEPLINPRTELQVREMFAHTLPDYGFRLVRSGDEFPDWLLVDDSGQFIHAEVEYRSSAFKAHGHDPSLCDLVVCWEHDDNSLPLPVLEFFSELIHQPSESLIRPERKPSGKNIPIYRSGCPRQLHDAYVSIAGGKAGNVRREEAYRGVSELMQRGVPKKKAIAEVAQRMSLAPKSVRTYFDKEKQRLLA